MKSVSKSPWRSHAVNPYDFPKPPAKLNPCRTAFPNGNKFESSQAARNEDFKRARRLKCQKSLKVRSLGGWLQEVTANRSLPLSLASSSYWRALRRRLPAALVSACEIDQKIKKITPFTLILSGHKIAKGKLTKLSVGRLKSQFRNILVTSGVEDADGILFACLHGEYDGDGYQLHFHGFVAGAKAAAFKNLSRHPALQTSKTVYRPIQTGQPIKVTDSTNLVRWLTYCLKPYWPWQPYWFNSDGTKKKACKRRLKPQQEIEFLTWMASQNIGDLLVLMGLRLTDLKRTKHP